MAAEKMPMKTVLAVAFALASLAVCAGDRMERTKWWSEDRFGMFIHFGIYSQAARHEKVLRNEKMTPAEYARYFELFNPDLFNAREWAQRAKRAGMKYAVLTAKHHDGFCLFDSRFTDYKVTNTPFKRDIVREFVDAFRAEGLKVGVYYSLLDWHHPDFTVDKCHPQWKDAETAKRQNAGRDWTRYRAYMKDQIRELMTNYGKISIAWFDYSYPGENGKGQEDWDSEGVVKLVRELQPGIILDNRLDLKDDPDGWDFVTPEQYKVAEWPKIDGKRVPWEVCQTFSGSWGYYRDEHSWKDAAQVIDLLAESVSKGGNVMLNVGPTGRGTFDARAKQRLAEIGDWMEVNSRAIYGCTEPPADFKTPANTILTYNPKTNRLYIHLLTYPMERLPVSFGDRIYYAQFLHDASEIKLERMPEWQKENCPVGSDDAFLALPNPRPDVMIPVIEIVLKESDCQMGQKSDAKVGLCDAIGKVVKARSGEDLNMIRDRVRAWRAEDVARTSEKVVVELSPGRYEQTAPVMLGPQDSFVEWRAAPGGEVRVAGGLLVTSDPEQVTDQEILDLLPEKARDKVVAFDLHRFGIDDWGDYLYNSEDALQRRLSDTWGEPEFIMGSYPQPRGLRSSGRMEVFVDDVPLTVARSAIGSFYHVDRLLGKILHRGHAKIECTEEGRFTVKESFPASWVKEPDPYVCGCWCHDWAEQHQRIVKIDQFSRTLELSRPWHQYQYKSGGYFYGFNMLSELDEPGEWYVHRKTGKLIAWLPEGRRGEHRIELSMSPGLFVLTGAKDVAFRGLVFETCRNSAVRMKDCADCRIEDCTIRNVGQHALVVEDGERCGARSCRLYGMGGGGVWLMDGNRETLNSSGHYVEDCDIHDFGRWNRMYRPGVCLSGVGMRAERNRIHDSPHAAILYFGCNLLMRSNEVYRVCWGSKDCGAIYTGRSWMLRGNKIEGNYIHDIIGLNGAMTRTVYLDDSVAQVAVLSNRFERCTWALYLGGVRECVISGNVFVDCPGAIYVDKRGTNWQKTHIDKRLRELAAKGSVYGLSCRQGPYVDAFPSVKDLPGPNPYEPVKNVIANNTFVRGEATWIKKYMPKRAADPRWWRDGPVTDDELREWGVFGGNTVDNTEFK